MKAETQEISIPPTPAGSDDLSNLMRQYGCGPIPFTGTDSGIL